MRRKILIGLGAVAVILGVFAIVVALQPSAFRIARTATIAAPPQAVFAQINDFDAWGAWSPWAKLDPAAKATFEGPSAGTGAIFRWSGNDKVGKGQMTLTESRPADLVRIKVDFVKPFEGSNTTEFTLKPEGNQTAVTWSMFGENDFIGKAICLFVDMDKMLGGDMKKGLSQMKAVVEGKK